ncbi:HTH domain-containing protein [Propionispora hippei]|uniref:DeoR-like helix-turn-helix domain-containing protein n=1 Tax=Propionispora hippei DSM 15287 TaxID=1123003 RepID=A0A1M6I6H0_9FIRM|nr:HTH domain-containing protein [Propionispora hippei]SHJ30049.1 DeoR-like helix-turn-helix domain-containing protein [Propionispora hippei DSM 15287]
MKELQQRQKQILKYLLSMDDFMPVKKIAALCRCSTKTVRNDLLVLEESGVKLEKMSGKGIRIFPEKQIRDYDLSKDSCHDLSVEYRRAKIMFELLEGTKDKLSIQSLSEKYFVSKTSIANDLKVVEEKLSKYHLRLKKDTQGTQLVGSEMDIRKAMVDILNALIGSKNVFQEEPARIDRKRFWSWKSILGHILSVRWKRLLKRRKNCCNSGLRNLIISIW